MIRRVFRPPRIESLATIDREAVDEIIYTTQDMRNRLLLELQARGGMRIGEVLKLTPGDIEGTRITLCNPKSGSKQEAVFIPKRVAGRLRTYIREQDIRSDGHVFPLT